MSSPLGRCPLEPEGFLWGGGKDWDVESMKRIAGLYPLPHACAQSPEGRGLPAEHTHANMPMAHALLPCVQKRPHMHACLQGSPQPTAATIPAMPMALPTSPVGMSAMFSHH